MNDTPKQDPAADALSFAEERLKLEREALAVERDRLAAARSHAEAEAKLAHGNRPVVMRATAILLAFAGFCAGVLVGVGVMEYRGARARDARLAATIAQLTSGAEEDVPMTNSAALPPDIRGRAPRGAHRNVSVIVIQ